MVTRAILRNWLVVGTAAGGAGFLQVYAANQRLLPALLVAGLGLTLGIIGGLIRLFVEWRRGGLGAEPERWPPVTLRHVVGGLAVVALTIGMAAARVADAPGAIYAAMIAIAVVVWLLSFTIRRNAEWPG